MKYRAYIYTLAMLGALALAAVSGGLLTSSDNTVYADHIGTPPNTAPEFLTDEDGQRSIAENTPAGVNIGAPVSATDADGDTLTYTLGGADETSFDIDKSTGQLITKAELNREATGGDSYSVTVTVDDGAGADNSSADQNVTITVADVAEMPVAPAPPVVTTGSTVGSETTTLEINWYEPANTGPEINGYDYRHKKATDTSWTEVTTSSTGTNDTISGLIADTAYQVSVRAKNNEDTSPWSLSATGSTNKEGNAAPVFAGTTSTRTVPENTPSGQNVGAVVVATDANSSTLTYSLAGRDADSFDIDDSTGQILTTGSALNFEGKPSYTVMVVVVDGDGGSDVIVVTITVSDVSEVPSRPDAPTVTAWDNPDTDDDESTTTLEVSWVAPETMGPAITAYDVEHREGTSGAFMDGPQDVADTSTTIPSLKIGTTYQVRVMATGDDEGDSQWSHEGTGSTNAANNAPAFSTQANDRNVLENTPAGRNIGAPVTATDDDSGDRLTYSLDQAGAETFDVDKTNGQLRTKASLDHEAMPSYSVTVTATDSKGSTATATVNIAVQDVNEPPLAPSKPTVTAGSDTSLVVTWAAPDNEGRPDITSFEVECSGADCPQQASPHGPTELTTTITGLRAFTRYTVRVKAINDEGNGPSASGSEYTNNTGNTMPVFDDGEIATRSVAENTQRGQPVGTTVVAQDGDNDDLTYSLGGVHAALFDIDRSTGLIKVKDALNHEAECSADDADESGGHSENCDYSVDVKVVDGNGGSDTISVTITVTDVTTEAPSAPSTPSVRAAEPTDDEPNLDPTTMLSVSWVEPQNAGPAITSYEVRYKVSVGGSWESSADTNDNVEFDNGDTNDNVEFDNGDTNDGTTRGATITGLDHDTTYEVQVQATNAEGGEHWSDSGTGKTHFANARPRFNNRSAVELHVDENTPSGQTIGVPVDASDVDGHLLTYTLEGVHKDLFTINGRSGHIRTGASLDLDYESRRSYSLTVRADDGRDADNSTTTTSVTITVRDQDESPLRPAAPTVSGIAGSTSDVRVTWDEPSNDGPSIIDYDVQYRTGGGGFKPWTHEGTDRSTIITRLSAGTNYEVQVRASNGEGQSEWSSSGSGSPDPDETNNPPAFSGGPRTFSVAENTDAGANIGSPVTATDPDRDPLTYTLEGTDAASFDIDPISGQIRTRSALNYEAKDSYAVTVKADDRRGGADTIEVTITVTDIDGEAPTAPAAPTVEATPRSSTSLDVSWEAPENNGPPITDYDVQYRDASSRFTSWPHDGDDRSATITGLTADTSYDVQILARNDEGMSGWSDSGTGSTNATVTNRPPVFSDIHPTRSVPENTPPGTDIDSPVSATDLDDDTLTYTIGGADAASFDIVSTSGQIQTKAALDFEMKSGYSVTVTADDGNGGSDTITVTISVMDVIERPSRPAAPTITATSGSTESLDVSWDEPDNQGPPITDYDVQYREGSGGSFTPVTHDGTATTTRITGLTAGTTYQVQVRATNDEGIGEWSASGTGLVPGANNPPTFSTATATRSVAENTPAGQNVGIPVSATDPNTDDTLTYTLTGADAASFDIVPDTGQLRTRAALDYETDFRYSVTVTVSDGELTDSISVTITIDDMHPSCASAIANGANTGLANDCEALLDSKQTLEGTTGSLNWATFIPITQWDGIRMNGDTPSLEGTPTRVTRLFLHRSGLNGTIPPELGRVTELEWLYLHANDLTGGIPGALNNLAKLERLYLYDNDLTGISGELGSGMAELRRLFAQRNRITGSIPANLGDMPRLDWLRLDRNRLTGAIPSQLGNLSTLRRLYMHEQEGWRTGGGFSGTIPSTFSRLSRLEYLVLNRNSLTGTIPTWLGGLPNLKWLGLYDNGFTGSIPAQLGSLSNLERLYLHRNQLTGSVPTQLGSLSSLTNLWLKNNLLSGPIPEQLGQLELNRLRLTGSGLTGCVPEGLVPTRTLYKSDGTEIPPTDDIEEAGLTVCGSGN